MLWFENQEPLKKVAGKIVANRFHQKIKASFILFLDSGSQCRLADFFVVHFG